MGVYSCPGTMQPRPTNRGTPLNPAPRSRAATPTLGRQCEVARPGKGQGGQQMAQLSGRATKRTHRPAVQPGSAQSMLTGTDLKTHRVQQAGTAAQPHTGETATGNPKATATTQPGRHRGQQATQPERTARTQGNQARHTRLNTLSKDVTQHLGERSVSHKATS